MYKYAGVIVNNDAVAVDKLFTYEIPMELWDKIRIGHRVKVPFGMGNKLIEGFVLSIHEAENKLNKIKDIKSIVDEFPLLTENDISLINFMKKKYLCSYIDCIKLIIPIGITKGNGHKFQQLIYIGRPLDDKYSKSPYIDIYDFIKSNQAIYSKNKLSKELGFSLSSINTLIKYEYLSLEKQVVNRFSREEYDKYNFISLNEEQKKAYETIKESKTGVFLLHGITGSGKTEIYLQLVKDMLSQERDTIVLVPEISLTPQMVERFKGRFGDSISVYHSKMSDGERYDEWMRIKNGKTKIVIGARSAIFLPFKNIGMIILDEEHEGSYKSENSPKYDARELAEFIAMDRNCKVVYGTATPSIENYTRAKVGEVNLLEIKNRVDGARLPEIALVDMREELMEGNKSIFSRSLFSNMKETLEKGEQVILFLNRRGFSTFVSCRKCGFVYKCNNCDISLTYHRNDGYLHCHYCGYKRKLDSKCPECGSKYIKYFGVGTERVEQEVKKYFPSYKVSRMDLDTTKKKDSYINIYKDFKNGKSQILIGTQMIAKGLDFPNVTLVGVLAADLTLNIPDYKSAERTFQLLTQVSGRAGRGDKAGKVVVQTYTPDHYSILSSINNNYNEFFEKEILVRKSMNYPPFSDIININLNSENETLLIKVINELAVNIKSLIQEEKEIDMLGPCACAISKIKEMYRWQIILKGRFSEEFKIILRDTIYNYLKNVYNEIKLNLDINPNSLI
ncbi:primosomal protein N' [Clostridium sp. 19966]|uniref:primosomal protein N' n=1 Tax=Clostridium sp. 19966 TaxID=2768166 RepID=UPI0028DE8947|nr:primosomal protein N' [Clostridium sp. 19966]MDT8716477.1 primosomal protein N' [Clostridium sp. 19966]